MTIRLGITDDHLLVINGIKAMMADFPQIGIVFAENNGNDLLNQLKNVAVDVLLLDINLPDISGIDLCRTISREYPSIRIIALTSFGESHYVKQMIRNGAAGYVLKNTDQQTLFKAIELVYQGEQFLDPQVQQMLLKETLSGTKQSPVEVILTRRETEILSMIAQECTNQEIADKLFISLRTVQTHRLNLSQKLNAKNAATLVKEAYKRGLI